MEIVRAIKKDEEVQAKERQREAGRERGRGKKASGKLPGAKGEAAEKAAKATGKERRTVEKAEEVIFVFGFAERKRRPPHAG